MSGWPTDMSTLRQWRSHAFACSLLVLVVTSSLFSDAHAQLQRFTTGFRSDASRYVWTAGIDIDRRSQDWSFSLINRFRSEAFLLSRQVNEFRDENETFGRVSRSLTQRFWMLHPRSPTLPTSPSIGHTVNPCYPFSQAITRATITMNS